MPHEEFIVLMMVLSSGIALVFFFAFPLRKAWLRKIEGASPTRDLHLVEDVEMLRDRVGELEERLDFTERLLAQQREGAALPPGAVR